MGNSVLIYTMLVFTVTAVWSVPVSRNTEKQETLQNCAGLQVNRDSCSSYWSDQKPPLLVVSLDGFRFDYLNRTINVNGIEEPAAPTIKLLAECGVWAHSGMMPSFPSLTFPNHYSIATGLYPESHGIVGNSFYDPHLENGFTLSSPQSTNPLWWKGEPVWSTARRQGKISATYFWPGSDMRDPTKSPSYWFLYDGKVPYEKRMEQVLEWLSLPIVQRPNIITIYLDEPDHTGHNNSPDAAEVNDMIKTVDTQLETLLRNMETEGIAGCVDVIVLSDHGMAHSPPGEKFFILEDILQGIAKQARIYDGVFPTISAFNDTEEEQDRIAQQLECKNASMRVYDKWELPRRHHYANSQRIPSLLLDMSISWRAYVNEEYILRGNHGWDNLNSEMQALFVAQGPSFKTGLTVRPFHNIELYNLMCTMIGIEASPNNGTWGSLHHMLVSPPADPTSAPLEPAIPLSYPANQSIYEDHLQRKKCNLLSGVNNASIDLTLDLSQAEIDTSFSTHTPWGIPQSSKIPNNVKIVVSTNYITGFDVVTGLPSWTSYTLSQQLDISANVKWRLDIRLEKNYNSICDRLGSGIGVNTTTVPLFPFGKYPNDKDIEVDTNAIEISTRFLNYWTEFHKRLSESITTNGETNVIVGPVRDSPSSGLFVVVTNCKNTPLTECPIDNLDVQSFIFPTKPKYNRDCVPADEFFAVHLAMLRDVQQTTGLEFLPGLSFRDRVDILSRTPFESKLLANPDPRYR